MVVSASLKSRRNCKKFQKEIRTRIITPLFPCLRVHHALIDECNPVECHTCNDYVITSFLDYFDEPMDILSCVRTSHGHWEKIGFLRWFEDLDPSFFEVIFGFVLDVWKLSFGRMNKWCVFSYFCMGWFSFLHLLNINFSFFHFDLSHYRFLLNLCLYTFLYYLYLYCHSIILIFA